MVIAAQTALERLGEAGLLPLLLADKTSRRAIIWATDEYGALGPGYGRLDEITPEALLRAPFRLMSRAEKAQEAQQERTRTHAEVFTPLWVVRKMNSALEADWFGYDEPFAAERVFFPKRRRWQRFVDCKCLEITCGEAPFLVTRYDVTSGRAVPLSERAGLLDHKMRVVQENTADEQTWRAWTLRAFQSVYGYEFQGDNVLLSRLNLLCSYAEYTRARWGCEPVLGDVRKILNVIAWNIFQMDGLTYTIPHHELLDEYEQMSFWPDEASADDGLSMRPCRVFDWRAKQSVAFASLRRRYSA